MLQEAAKQVRPGRWPITPTATEEPMSRSVVLLDDADALKRRVRALRLAVLGAAEESAGPWDELLALCDDVVARSDSLAAQLGVPGRNQQPAG
jgi:hypothetical protein